MQTLTKHCIVIHDYICISCSLCGDTSIIYHQLRCFLLFKAYPKMLLKAFFCQSQKEYETLKIIYFIWLFSIMHL